MATTPPDGTSYIGDSDICLPGSSFHQFCSEIVAQSSHHGGKSRTQGQALGAKLLVSFTNFGYLDMAENFLLVLERLGIYNVVMFALDLPSYERLKSQRKKTWLLAGREETVFTQASSNFGSPEFNTICNVKPWIVHECLKGGFDVVWTDTDVVWIRDCQPFFDIHPDVDVQLQGDDDDICAGFFYAKSTAANIALLTKVLGYVNTCMDDQTALRRFLNEEEGLAHRITSKPADLAMTHFVEWKEPQNFKLSEGVANYLVLPRSVFPNGTAYYNVKLPQRFGRVPFIVHNNCIIGHDSKVDRFKMHNQWLLPTPLDYDYQEVNERKTRVFRPLFALTPHREVVTCLSLHPDGTSLYTSAYDKIVHTYKLEQLEAQVATNSQSSSDIENDLAIVRISGRGLLNRRGGVWCMAWEARKPADEAKIKAQQTLDAILQMATSKTNSWPAPSEAAPSSPLMCFTGGHDRHVMVWDADKSLEETVHGNQGGWQSRHVLKGHQSVVNDVLYHRDQLFSASDDGTVWSWDPIKGEKTRIYRAGSSWMSAIAADGPALFAASHDGCAYAWDIASARIVQVYLGHQGWVRAIAVDGANKRVYTAGADSSIREWDMIPGDPLRIIYHAHTGGINAIQLDKGAKVLYTASDDGFIRAWDLATWRCIAEYAGHSGIVTCILLTPNFVISGGADHTVKVWPLARSQGSQIAKLFSS